MSVRSAPSRRAVLAWLGGTAAVGLFAAVGCSPPSPTATQPPARPVEAPASKPAAPEPTRPAAAAKPDAPVQATKPAAAPDSKPAAAPDAKPAGAAPVAQAKAGLKAGTVKAHTRADVTQQFMHVYGKEFEQANPSVKVAVEEIPANEYFVKIRAMAAARQLGDVVWGLIGGGAWLNFAAVGILRAVDDLAKPEGPDFLKQWYEPTVQVGMLDGKLYGLAEMSTPGNAIMVFNETAVGEAGLKTPTPDWELEKDFLPAAEKLTRRAGDRVDRFGAYLEKSYLGLVPMLRRWGGELLNPEGTSCVLSSPENERAVQFLLDAEQRHKVAPTSQQIEENATKMFVSGKVAVLANVTPAALTTSYKPVGDKFKVTATLTPRGPNGAGTMLAAHHFGITVNSQLVQESWELIKVWTSKEVGVQKVLRGWGSPGGRPDVYNDPRVQEADPVYKPASHAMEKLQPHLLPKNVRGTEMTTVLNNELDQIWLGKVPVGEGLKRAQGEVQKVLDKPR
jgi:ABC-type glycerol-3-phosphate transport system substrate-binding protein